MAEVTYFSCCPSSLPTMALQPANQPEMADPVAVVMRAEALLALQDRMGAVAFNRTGSHHATGDFGDAKVINAEVREGVPGRSRWTMKMR